MRSVLHWLTVVSQGGRAWCESGSTQNSSSLFQPGHTVPNKLSCAKFSDHIFPADLACVYDLLGKRSLTGQSLESDWTGFVSWLPKHLMAAQNTLQQRTQVPEGIPPLSYRTEEFYRLRRDFAELRWDIYWCPARHTSGNYAFISAVLFQ